ncbi:MULTISPECIES: exo-alpha-sialidase [unclassified Arenibacter]|uniref:sialidase family protein n=1 Tax=unclassified Arenibacter TaxID=2615047 RepID=UPI000E34250D|nr:MULTISPECIES: sialidase family protein [unclassified Arenibacter]MCM4162222.1 sialidase [Arenibacter sp. A80]RFT58343.1 sialidase [Arenibacter sp. P308M17]
MKTIPFFLTVLTFTIFSCKDKAEKKPSTEADKSGNDITGNFTLPPLSQPGEGAYLSGGLLYPLDNKPTPECHASTIVETPTGLVCAFFAGTHERNPDVGIRVSRMVNGKWTWPEEVANGVQNDTLRYPLWNPVLFQPKEGPLLLFYKEGPDPRTWWGMLMTSSDDGKTWSKPEKMGMDEKIGHLLGPVKNKPIQLEDGTIISPTSTEIMLDDGDVDWMVHFEISKDKGKTWEVVGPINDGKEFDAIQPSILTYPNGKMQVLCRTRQNVISQSWSDDQGQTWSKMTATELPNPNSGTDAVTLADNRQLLIYNHTTKEGEEPKGRNMLNLAISDNGTDWKPVMTLENVPAESGYSYPAIIQTSDGLVHITYTYVRQSVKHVVIDPKQL